MSFAIKFGSRNIPVIATLALTGNPASSDQVPAAVVTAARNLLLAQAQGDYETIYDKGVEMYEGYNGRSPDGQLWTKAEFSGGITPLQGDGGNIIVGTPDWIGTVGISTMKSTVSMQHSGSTVNLTDFASTFGYTGYSNYDDWDSDNAVAVEYHYPQASTEAGQRTGYVILMVHFRKRIGGTTDTKSYVWGNYTGYPLPNINVKHSWDVSYTPIYVPDDPNDEEDPAEEDGGDGDHTPTYDPIPIPNKPTQGAATAGFVTLYKLHQGIMSQFASDCFASNLWEALKLFFSNPMDFLVGVNLLPFEPAGGLSWKPKFGAISFTHAYPTVANQYVDVDCGSITIPKYWGSAFDFEPYTKIQIWLPYIGYRDLPVDEIMGSTISVKYRCDCLTGDCVAFVHIGVVGEIGPQIPRVIAQFYGNCAVRVPFSSVSYDSAINNSIALIGAAAASGISAGAGSISEGTKIGAGLHAGINAAGEEMVTNSSGMGVVSGLKPNIHKGGAAGASTGYMSIQVPYIIRRIPRQNLPSNYKELKGYPSNIGGKLADFSGLAIVDDIQLNNIPALEDERKEIINWLRGGVLI